MNRLTRSKKGFNDISILSGLIGLLIMTSIFIPFVNEATSQSTSEFNIDPTLDDVQQEAENVSTLNAFSVLLTLLKLSFWDFGDTLGLPFWLDGFFTLISILIVVILARNIWVGGGS